LGNLFQEKNRFLISLLFIHSISYLFFFNKLRIYSLCFMFLLLSDNSLILLIFVCKHKWLLLEISLLWAFLFLNWLIIHRRLKFTMLISNNCRNSRVKSFLLVNFVKKLYSFDFGKYILWFSLWIYG